jgi:hypothetical protein
MIKYILQLIATAGMRPIRMSSFTGFVVSCAGLLFASSLALAGPVQYAKVPVVAEAELRSPQEIALADNPSEGLVGLPAGTRVKLIEETTEGWKVSCYAMEFVVPSSALDFGDAAPAANAASAASKVQATPAASKVQAASAASQKIYDRSKYIRTEMPYLQRNVDTEVELKGLVEAIPHKKRKNITKYVLNTFDGDRFSLPILGRNTKKGVTLKGFGGAAVTVKAKVRTGATGDWRNASISWLEAIERLDPAEADELIKFSEERYFAERQREYNPSPNALPYSGTWGVRMSIPTEKNGIWEVEDFDAAVFAQQVAELTTATHVIINVTQPSGPCYFTGPHPELEKILNTRSFFSGPKYTDRGSFPRRDVLGETLDAVRATGKKTLVYFACEGFHTGLAKEGLQDVWFNHIETLGLTHYEAVAELLLKHYAERYKDKIDGWWFDGSGALRTPQQRQEWRDIVLASNPKAVIAFNRMAGPPFRSSAECDYFGGHPEPRSVYPFSDPINLPMITAIEQSPWMNCRGEAVGDPKMSTLGHVFMGMQDRWTLGKCNFPSKQAVDWTTRVVASGGMYTWAVPRAGSKMAAAQFKLLKKIDAAIAELRKSQ